MTLDLLEISRAPEILHTWNCHPSVHKTFGALSVTIGFLVTSLTKTFYSKLLFGWTASPGMTYLLPFQNDGDPCALWRFLFLCPQDLSLDSPVCALKVFLLTSWPGFTLLCIISYGTLYLSKTTFALWNLPQMDSNQDVEAKYVGV